MQSIQGVKIWFAVRTVRVGVESVRALAHERVILHRTDPFVTVIRCAFELTIVPKKRWLTKITASSVKVSGAFAARVRTGAMPAAR